MIYQKSITVAAGTLQSYPVKENITLSSGIIHQINVVFPPGPQNLVFISITRGLHQIFPTNPDGFFRGDNINITGDLFHVLLNRPLSVDIRGWAPDASYSHVIDIYIWVKRVWQLDPFSDEMGELAIKDSLGVS